MKTTALASTRFTAIRIHCPVEESSFRSFLAGDAAAIERDPVAARILAIVRGSNPLGDLGLYKGVVEIAGGSESFIPTSEARPARGAAGVPALSPTAVLTTYVPEDAPQALVAAALAEIIEAHPWEVPVIETCPVELLTREG